MIIEFQPPRYVQGLQPPDQAAWNFMSVCHIQTIQTDETNLKMSAFITTL